MTNHGFNYAAFMRALNPETATRIGCGNRWETNRSRRVRLQFDWLDRDSSALGDGETFARRATRRHKKVLGAAQ